MIEYNENLEKLDKELDEIWGVWWKINDYLSRHVSALHYNSNSIPINDINELTKIYLEYKGINSFKDFLDRFNNTKKPLSYEDFNKNYNNIAIKRLRGIPSNITQNFLDALISEQYRISDSYGKELFQKQIKPLQNESGSWKIESEEYKLFDFNLLMRQFDKKLNNIIKEYAIERLKTIKEELEQKTEEELKKDLQIATIEALGFKLMAEEKLLKPILQNVDFTVKEPYVFSTSQDDPLLYLIQNKKNIFSFLSGFINNNNLKNTEFCKTLIAMEKAKIEQRRLENENKKLKDDLSKRDQQNTAGEFKEMWEKAEGEDRLTFLGIIGYYIIWLAVFLCGVNDVKSLQNVNDILIWLLPKVPFIALFWVGLVILNSKRKNAHNEYLYFAHLQKMLNGMIAYKQHGENDEVKEAYLINGMRHLTRSPLEGLEVKNCNEAKLLKQLNVLKQVKNLFK
jgi:hypothetical protein